MAENTRPQANKRPSVVVTRKLPEIIETRMIELFEPQLNLDDMPMGRAALAAAMNAAEVLVPTVTDRIDAGLIAGAGPQLKLIASFGTGVDHIDLTAARARGIIVTNTPGVLTDDTADFTLALILALSRRIIEGEALARSGNWGGWSPTGMLGHRLSGKKLGILGMGRIGRAVARRARAFGLAIHYHNRRQVRADVEAELEASYWSSLDRMLNGVDILSVNCPHTPATYHLINARRLSMMKPDALIVNTSRGEVIDERALIKRLREGDLGGAALDVFEREPDFNPRLRMLKNAVLMPHMGSATIEGRVAMGERVLLNIRSFADGHSPPDRVLETEF